MFLGSDLMAASIGAPIACIASQAAPHSSLRASFAAAKVYLSEGRDAAKLAALKHVAGSQPGVALRHVFVDEPYNRVNFTLASSDSLALSSAAVELSRAALQLLDLRQHSASHPRLGVVDHISVQPVGGSATLETAADVARALGRLLGSGDSALPVMLYGHAHREGRSLARLRRSLGYFAGSSTGQWSGELGEFSGNPPDFGPSLAAASAGVACVGATPWVTNLNIPLRNTDMTLCRQIARSLSARGGGLPAVEAMALPHRSGVEIACNLLDEGESSVADVMRRVRELLAEAGAQLVVGEDLGSEPGSSPYVLGRTRAQLLAL